jgi:hypothetical protein
MFFKKRPKTDNLDPLVPYRWSLCKSYALAFAIAAFPVLFLLDQAVSWGTSPILPGLLAIIIIWIFSPLVAFEIFQRLRPNSKVNPMSMARRTKISRVFIGVSTLWFVLWLAVGA